jgi:hypothetical protein
MSQMFLNVVSTFKGDGIQQANRQLGAFGKATSSFGSTLGKVATALAAFGVAAKAVQFGRESITAARDLERNLYALDTIFGDLAPSMRDFAKDAENIGLSQSKAAKASTFIGSVLKQSGFAMEDVGKETKNLVTLGTDLAALYGYDVQEALLGMTALFRGEYDPIEKFGVAMKQQEINSELAARGQDKLEGAARRNAEQTIRLELLYQRAADAMGAFTGQSGSLYTEQKKLGATFENMQAQLGTALLPAIVDVNEQLRLMLKEATPGLIEMFNGLAAALEGLMGMFRDAMNPTTELGESFAALGIQLESLGRTLFGEDFNIAKFFEIASGVLGFFLDLMHDLLALVENLVIAFQVMGHQIGLLFSGKFEELVNFDGANAIRNLISIKEGIKDFRLETAIAEQAVKDLNIAVTEANKGKLDDLQNTIYQTGVTAKEAAIQMGLFSQAAGITPPGGGTPPPEDDGETEVSGGGAAPKKKKISGLPALIADAKKNAKVLRKEVKLQGQGLSEEVAKWVTGSNTPVKAANQALRRIAKNGDKAIKNLTKNYQNSAAGQQAAAAAFAEAEADRIEQQRENERIAEELRRAEEARIAEQKRVYESFLDSVKSTFAGIKNAIMGAFDITGLGSSASSVIRNMNKLLTKVKDFSKNISQLASMGLDPALLQQVIQAGPMAGARLAASLVAGGAGALGQINTAYGEFGSFASEIATTGTNSMFGTQAQQSVYNINVSGGVGSGATIGKAIVDAIKAYERTSGAVWQGA